MARKTNAAIINGRPLFIGQAPSGRPKLEETRIYTETALKAIPIQNVISDMSLIIFGFMSFSLRMFCA